MKLQKQIVAIITVLVLALSFSSCGQKIPTEYAAYYTETSNSLLWCRGNSSDGEKMYNPQIEIIDRDPFGRVLFSYKEGFSVNRGVLSDLNIYAFLIMQAEDDEFVYYYEDDNYVCLNFTDYQEDVCHRQIDELKTVNDWGKEFNADKCIKKTKSTKKNRNNFDSNVKSFIDSKEKEVGDDLRTCISAQDNYGRTVISISEFGLTPWQGRLIVCIVQPDGSIICSDDYNLTFDYFEYHDNLRALKKEANWNNDFITS